MWHFLRPDAESVLRDDKCRRSLARYFDILENRKIPNFLIAKRLAANVDFNGKDEKLWKAHDDLIKEFQFFEDKIDRKEVNLDHVVTPDFSFYDLKMELTKRMLKQCHFCIRSCKVDRLDGNAGFCGSGEKMVVSTIFEHVGEEAELVPSGTIFTCGCTLRCLHCQNWTISQWYEVGEVYSDKELAREVENLKRKGCRNVNLVGGDPTPWLKHWLDVFRHVEVKIPIVWNSNSYYSEETAKLLVGFADVYLLDYKYGSDECANRISSAPNYVETAQKNLLYATKYGELIIRILLLPKHIECCAKPMLKWTAENLGTWVRVNIMDQYRPEWKAYEIPELQRRLLPSEYKEAVEYAKSLGLTNLA